MPRIASSEVTASIRILIILFFLLLTTTTLLSTHSFKRSCHLQTCSRGEYPPAAHSLELRSIWKAHADSIPTAASPVAWAGLPLLDLRSVDALSSLYEDKLLQLSLRDGPQRTRSKMERSIRSLVPLLMVRKFSLAPTRSFSKAPNHLFIIQNTFKTRADKHSS
jgi:hypothetical protein